MSFLFPRLITVTRPPNDISPGAQGYSSLDQREEWIVVRDVPASIQQRATAGQTGAQLPGDTRANTAWRILIPLRALNDPAAIQFRDVVIDDLGRRYQVTAPYFGSMGFNLLVEHMQV